MRNFVFIFMIYILLTPDAIYAASPAVVYEPHRFTREIAKPETFTDTFDVCDPSGAFTLVVENGDENGKNRISSGVISINGVPVVSQSDFSQKVSRIEKPIANIREVNEVTVDVGSRPWSYVTVSVEGLMSCLEVFITEPEAGSTVNRGTALVRGTIDSETADVGVRVNGVLAGVNGESWMAMVPLKEGENIFTATATDGSGNSAEKSVTINCDNPVQPMTVSANPASGMAPMETTFSIDSNIANVSLYRIDFDGDGVVDLETTITENIVHKYETPGLYLPVITAVDSSGEEYSEMTVVNVMSLEQMDTLFKGKWHGLLNELGQGNAERALGFFSVSQKEKYRRVFDDLGGDLQLIVSTFGDIVVNSIEGEMAEYVTVREQDGDKFAYFIYFMRDQNGIWKIKGM